MNNNNLEEKNQEIQEELKNEKNNETENLKVRKNISKNEKLNHIDLSIYNELDDFAAEVLDTDNFLKYIEARREYLFEAEEAVKKYLGEEFLNDSENKIAHFQISTINI